MGSGNLGEVARTQIRGGRKADFRFVHLTGQLEVLYSGGGVCCYFIFFMAAVQTEVSLYSQPWQRPLHIYGGLVCNSLMAGKLLFLLRQCSSVEIQDTLRMTQLHYLFKTF